MARRQLDSERMELHQRIAFGFIPLVFGVLGVALALLPRTSRPVVRGDSCCACWLLVYYVLLPSVSWVTRDIYSPSCLCANLTLGFIALVFFRKAMRESPLVLPAFASRVGSAILQRVKRIVRRTKD
jgi:lipopolysaccharide export LptBFGC system permease protein LptF